MTDLIENDDTASPVRTAVRDEKGVGGFLPIRDWSGPARVRAVALLLVVIVASLGLAWNMYRQSPTPSGPPRTAGAAFNGFDISNATIPTSEILRGGPPRDGIPAILKPKFVSVADATFLKDSDMVLGFIHEDEAHVYPLRILVWHEIANDTVGGLPIAVTYCPLCGTCMVFERRIGGETLTFGVSGLLYQSDVLMYDHQTESLWSQLKMESVAGKGVGTKLRWLESKQMTWAAWKRQYPQSMVLSPDTGYRRDYAGNAYASYKKSGRVMFPVPETRTELGRKEWVLGVILGGDAKAYSIEALSQAESPLKDTVGGQAVVVTYDAEAEFAGVTTDTGEPVPSVKVYWFAWQGFYPDTALFVP